MSTPYQSPLPPAPAKKVSPWVWILGILGVLVLMVGVLIAGGAWFVYSKAKQAGLDPESMKKNPVMATAKMVTAFSPDLELLSADEATGVIRVKNKKDGKVMILNFERAKKGEVVLQEEGKEPVTIQTNGGPDGGLVVKSKDGTMEMGSGEASLPSWLPSYPGAKFTGNFSTKTDEQAAASMAFTSADAPEKLAEYYREALKTAGLKITTNVTNTTDNETSSVLAASDDEKKRDVMITITKSADGSTGTITYTDKK